MKIYQYTGVTDGDLIQYSLFTEKGVQELTRNWLGISRDKFIEYLPKNMKLSKFGGKGLPATIDITSLAAVVTSTVANTFVVDQVHASYASVVYTAATVDSDPVVDVNNAIAAIVALGANGPLKKEHFYRHDPIANPRKFKFNGGSAIFILKAYANLPESLWWNPATEQEHALDTADAENYTFNPTVTTTTYLPYVIHNLCRHIPNLTANMFVPITSDFTITEDAVNEYYITVGNVLIPVDQTGAFVNGTISPVLAVTYDVSVFEYGEFNTGSPNTDVTDDSSTSWNEELLGGKNNNENGENDKEASQTASNKQKPNPKVYKGKNKGN